MQLESLAPVFLAEVMLTARKSPSDPLGVVIITQRWLFSAAKKNVFPAFIALNDQGKF